VPVFVRAELYGVLTVYLAEPSTADDTVSAVGLLAQEVGLAIAGGLSSQHLHLRQAPRPVIAAAS